MTLGVTYQDQKKLQSAQNFKNSPKLIPISYRKLREKPNTSPIKTLNEAAVLDFQVKLSIKKHLTFTSLFLFCLEKQKFKTSAIKHKLFSYMFLQTKNN